VTETGEVVDRQKIVPLLIVMKIAAFAGIVILIVY